MKRILFITVFAGMYLTANSQSQFLTNGNNAFIGVGGIAGIDATYGVTIRNSPSIANGVLISNASTAAATWRMALNTGVTGANNRDIAYRGSVVHSSPLSYSRAYGTYLTAGNATSGYNYGVFSYLSGSNNGTAIFGMSQAGANEQVIGGQFAGYFMGRSYFSERVGIGYTSPAYTLDVNGTIRCTTLTQTSDLRAKSNVQELGAKQKQIEMLRPVTYTMLPEDLEARYNLEYAKQDTGKVVTDYHTFMGLEDKSRDKDRKHIGFIAQEFREVFPELVYEDEKGMLSIDYVSLIPVLVGTIQEMSETIQTLSKRLEAIENTSKNVFMEQGDNGNNVSFTLFPNPTDGFVTVDYTLYVDAPISFEIYSMLGQRVKLIVPNQNKKAGSYSVQASVSDLGTGTFIVKATSGAQVESKQLIINR
jgi:hypothetical protein